jgi:thiamine kinase-like enzyme
MPNTSQFEDPYRPYLPDTGSIKLTHGDLHRGNIIVSSTSPSRILALVDWAQSGWYPDYWEYCKACYTACYNGEWRDQWIPKVLSPRIQEYEVFAEYVMAMGSV